MNPYRNNAAPQNSKLSNSGNSDLKPEILYGLGLPRVWTHHFCEAWDFSASETFSNVRAQEQGALSMGSG